MYFHLKAKPSSVPRDHSRGTEHPAEVGLLPNAAHGCRQPGQKLTPLTCQALVDETLDAPAQRLVQTGQRLAMRLVPAPDQIGDITQIVISAEKTGPQTDQKLAPRRQRRLISRQHSTMFGQLLGDEFLTFICRNRAHEIADTQRRPCFVKRNDRSHSFMQFYREFPL